MSAYWSSTGAWLGLALAGVAAAAPVADEMWRLPPGTLAMRGRLGDEIELCLRERVAAQDAAELVQPMLARRDVTEWRSEFWGKWVTSAITAYRWQQGPELKEKIADAVAQLLRAQDAEGYIGAYTPTNRLQRWDVWGRKYTLLGLLAWHDVSGEPAALAAARREADHLLTEIGPGKGNPFRNDMWNGMATSSVLEPMVLLFNRTGDRRYLEFCEWLVAEAWPQAGGPDLLRKALAGTSVFRMFPGPDPTKKNYAAGGSAKAYEMMSCFEGLLELHRATGRADYRRAAEMVFANIRDTEITIIGSGSDWERWNNGANRQTEPWLKGMETCVTVTWIKFAAQLLRLTGDSAYADQIELASYNALLGALAPDGRWWAHHSPLAGVKERAPEQCGMHQNCCVASGPRGLMLLPELAVMQNRDGPVVNLYGPMTARVPVDGEVVRLEQESDYPLGDTVRLKLTPATRREFAVSLRIPAWSRRTEVTVNAEPAQLATAGTYFRLVRPWRPGDTVTIKFDLAPRLVRAPGAPKFAALMRGPVALALDTRLTPPDSVRKFDVAKVAAARILPQAAGAPFWLVCETQAPDGGQIAFCDFASAGNTWSPASAYKVWFELP